MKSKPSQNNIFHNFTSNPSFSKIFNNFDLELTLGGPKTLILIWPSELVETNAIARAIKGPRNPSNQKKKRLSLGFGLCLNVFYTFFLSSKHKKHTKTHQSFLIIFFTKKNTRYCSYTQSSSPQFYTLGFGVQECGCSFLAIIHTPNLLNLFPSIILLLCFNNMIY